MICGIVFPERQPRSLGLFDYKVPAELEGDIAPGQLVEAPFRRKTKTGIVLSCGQNTSVLEKKLKPLKKIVSTEAVLTQEQRSLVQWLSDETLSSLATTAQTFLPPFSQKRQVPSRGAQTDHVHIHTSPTIMIDTFDTMNDARTFISSLLLQKPKGPTCIIVPDLHVLTLFKKQYPEAVSYAATFSPKKKYESWKKIFQGAAPLCIGTRHALFLPYTHLQSIILFKEEDINYQRQEQHPDYDTFRIAHRLSHLHGANLHTISFAPRVQTFATVAPALRNFHTGQTANIHIIDKKVFYQKKQSAVLPDDLLDFFKEHTGRHAVLFNKKGRFRNISCPDCTYSPLCPTCGSGFIHELTKGGESRCAVCKNTSRLPDQCPHCGSLQFQGKTPGVRFLQESLLKQLPPSQRVAVMSRDDSHTQESAHADIIVGTDFMLSSLPWKSLSSFTILDIDTSLEYPDFRATEFTFQRLRAIHAQLPPSATCFILTSTPDHSVFRSLLKKDVFQFTTQELAVRKSLSYPPYSELILCSLRCRGTECHAKEEQLMKKIKSFESNIHSTITILSTSSRLPTQEKNIARVLIRIPTQHTKALISLLQHETSEWNCTRNPLDLFGS